MKYYVQIEDTEYGLDVHRTADGIVVQPIESDGTGEVAVDFATVHSNIDTGEGLY